MAYGSSRIKAPMNIKFALNVGVMHNSKGEIEIVGDEWYRAYGIHNLIQVREPTEEELAMEDLEHWLITGECRWRKQGNNDASSR